MTESDLNGMIVMVLNPDSYKFSRCSERSISFAEFRELLPSRCTLGLAFCKATCHAIARRDGTCEYGHVIND